MKKLSLIFLLNGCAYVHPFAKVVETPKEAYSLAQEYYEELGGIGEQKLPIIFLKQECWRGFYDQNGKGCVTGEVFYHDRIYVAYMPNWKQYLEHEVLHLIIVDNDHKSNRWIDNGYDFIARRGK